MCACVLSVCVCVCVCVFVRVGGGRVHAWEGSDFRTRNRIYPSIIEYYFKLKMPISLVDTRFHLNLVFIHQCDWKGKRN